MNFLFRISKMYTPDFLKKKELVKLSRVTASVFDTAIPSMTGLSFKECLATFARFTASNVDDAINKGNNLQAIQDKLYHGAYEIGVRIRKQFHVADASDVMEASRFLYRILGIDFEGTEQGAIVISECFFSQYYSSSQCRVISSLDAGLIAGLSNGGEMKFLERITEGSPFCKAQVQFKEQFS